MSRKVSTKKFCSICRANLFENKASEQNAISAPTRSTATIRGNVNISEESCNQHLENKIFPLKRNTLGVEINDNTSVVGSSSTILGDSFCVLQDDNPVVISMGRIPREDGVYLTNYDPVYQRSFANDVNPFSAPSATSTRTVNESNVFSRIVSGRFGKRRNSVENKPRLHLSERCVPLPVRRQRFLELMKERLVGMAVSEDLKCFLCKSCADALTSAVETSVRDASIEYESFRSFISSAGEETEVEKTVDANEGTESTVSGTSEVNSTPSTVIGLSTRFNDVKKKLNEVKVCLEKEKKKSKVAERRFWEKYHDRHETLCKWREKRNSLLSQLDIAKAENRKLKKFSPVEGIFFNVSIKNAFQNDNEVANQTENLSRQFISNIINSNSTNLSNFSESILINEVKHVAAICGLRFGYLLVKREKLKSDNPNCHDDDLRSSVANAIEAIKTMNISKASSPLRCQAKSSGEKESFFHDKGVPAAEIAAACGIIVVALRYCAKKMNHRFQCCRFLESGATSQVAITVTLPPTPSPPPIHIDDSPSTVKDVSVPVQVEIFYNLFINIVEKTKSKKKIYSEAKKNGEKGDKTSYRKKLSLRAIAHSITKETKEKSPDRNAAPGVASDAVESFSRALEVILQCILELSLLEKVKNEERSLPYPITVSPSATFIGGKSVCVPRNYDRTDNEVKAWLEWSKALACVLCNIRWLVEVVEKEKGEEIFQEEDL
eukprot:g2147.t1